MSLISFFAVLTLGSGLCAIMLNINARDLIQQPKMPSWGEVERSREYRRLGRTVTLISAICAALTVIAILARAHLP